MLRHVFTKPNLSFVRDISSIAERLMCAFVRGRSRVRIISLPNLKQRFKRFATASKPMQVAVLPWRYDAEMGTAKSLHALA